MNNIEPRTGYELAAKILATHPEDAIETMLRCSHGTECDWLEFKAGMTLLPEDEERGLKPDDLYWDYVLSIVAMANTRGGAFVIGVNDKTHEPVALSACDPRKILPKEGKEAYLRKEVLDRIDATGKQWKTKSGETWSLKGALSPFIEGKFVPFKGVEVIILLIQPCELGKEVFVQVTVGNLPFQCLPFRKLGEVGNVKKLTLDEDIKNFRAARNPSSPYLGVLFDAISPNSSKHENEEKTADLFICHEKNDSETATGLCQSLEAIGIKCWIAPRDIPVGEKYTAAIVHAIDKCSSFLLLISSHSIKSPHVNTELDQAFKGEKLIFPIRLDEYDLPDDWQKYYLSKSQIVPFLGNYTNISYEIKKVLMTHGKANKEELETKKAILEPKNVNSPSSTAGNAFSKPNSAPVSNDQKTPLDRLVDKFREAFEPNSAGVKPIIDIVTRSPMPNLESPTFGGQYWWDTLAESDGWKLQRNKLFKQFRILDNQRFRRAWGWRRGMERMFGICGTGKKVSNASPQISTSTDAFPVKIPQPERLSRLAERFQQATQPNEKGIAPILVMVERAPMLNRFIWAQGGYWCWETIVESNGWKLQRNKFFKQYRVRDRYKTCRACGWEWTMRLIFFPELAERAHRKGFLRSIGYALLRLVGMVLIALLGVCVIVLFVALFGHHFGF